MTVTTEKKILSAYLPAYSEISNICFLQTAWEVDQASIIMCLVLCFFFKLTVFFVSVFGFRFLFFCLSYNLYYNLRKEE